MWPGGMAVLANGDLYVVYGRWAHRLDRDCRVKTSLQLPVDAAYNSFVVLDCGLIVAKNLSDKLPARLSVIDPETMTEVGSEECPEASIARLSAVGDTVYVVGVTTIMRFDWGSAGLQQDRDWQWNYLSGSGNSYGWDVVLAGGQAWFMDNGHHRYRTTMVGAGVSRTPNRLLRVALGDSNDHQAVEISGIPGGSITNPPLIDTQRGLVIGYDSANRHLAAWRWDGKTLVPAWQKIGFACASHMLLYAESGELVTNDHGSGGEWVVVLDIETGAEKARARIGGLTQGVVFPSPGWGRDLYWCSMSRVARVFVD
jgi:hypothetical protein